jgi:hypothetical protein
MLRGLKVISSICQPWAGIFSCFPQLFACAWLKQLTYHESVGDWTRMTSLEISCVLFTKKLNQFPLCELCDGTLI